MSALLLALAILRGPFGPMVAARPRASGAPRLRRLPGAGGPLPATADPVVALSQSRLRRLQCGEHRREPRGLRRVAAGALLPSARCGPGCRLRRRGAGSRRRRYGGGRAGQRAGWSGGSPSGGWRSRASRSTSSAFGPSRPGRKSRRWQSSPCRCWRRDWARPLPGRLHRLRGGDFAARRSRCRGQLGDGHAHHRHRARRNHPHGGLRAFRSARPAPREWRQQTHFSSAFNRRFGTRRSGSPSSSRQPHVAEHVARQDLKRGATSPRAGLKWSRAGARREGRLGRP